MHAERERIETSEATLIGLHRKLSALRARISTVLKNEKQAIIFSGSM